MTAARLAIAILSNFYLDCAIFVCPFPSFSAPFPFLCPDPARGILALHRDLIREVLVLDAVVPYRDPVRDVVALYLDLDRDAFAQPLGAFYPCDQQNWRFKDFSRNALRNVAYLIDLMLQN